MTASALARAPLETLIKAEALGLGFDLVGITRLGPAQTAPRFEEWLDAGMAGGMSYLERGREKRRDSRAPVPGARSAIVVAMNYGGTQPPGAIARYARGRDYHSVMERRLRLLLEWLRDAAGDVNGKAYVDTGPLLERDLARKAGLGWFGKNSNVINPRLGSFFFIGALLVDVELTPDTPFTAAHCGTCTRCIDACPTGAIVGDGIVDAPRCISYLTIENRGAIPVALREKLGTLIYGCDICQDVCPWNRKFARETHVAELDADPRNEEPALSALLALDDATFAQRFSGSPVKRARRRGLARNVAVAMGNRRAPDDLRALERALASDPDPLVRSHCAWALGRFADDRARRALEAAYEREADSEVRSSIGSALARAGAD